MTLIVSLRIVEGTVIAGDSLATMMSQLQIKGELSVKCPKCGEEHIVEPEAEASFPGSTFSYAQKVFPFLDKYGVGTYGWGQVFRKTIYFAVRELENKLKQEGWEPEGVTEVAQKIGQHIHGHLIATIGADELKEKSADWVALGLQVVGYDDSEPKTVEITIGNKLCTIEQSDFGCTVSGRNRVVQAIWDLYEKHPQDQAVYDVFSLQDAIDYADFLIKTTASYERFSRNLAGVGGEIDIALVTPFDGFKWIRQKKLGKLIGGTHVGC